MIQPCLDEIAAAQTRQPSGGSPRHRRNWLQQADATAGSGTELPGMSGGLQHIKQQPPRLRAS